MKNVVLGYEDKFVGGFSYKTQKVYFVKTWQLAKKFTGIEANKFISLYGNSPGFETNKILYTRYFRGMDTPNLLEKRIGTPINQYKK